MTPVAGREGRRPTPAGERRRAAIVAAAAAILERDGFGAVSHRAVAREGGVPLASTTYYFASREELVAEAMAHMADGYLEHARAAASAPGERSPGERIVSMVAGPPGDDLRARLVTVYERYAQAARSPAVAGVAAGLTRELIALASEVLAGAGVKDPPRAARHAVALVDGLLLTALVEGGEADPTAGVAAELDAYLAALAPQRRP